MTTAPLIANILNIFEAFRMNPTPEDKYESVGKSILYDKIMWFVERNLPISFVMLGFPMKSKNTRDKVFGTLPDLGEQVSFENFAHFDALIRAIYPPGVNMTIVSDGFIFNDILGIGDSVVEEYKEMTMDMSKVAPMTWFDMTDFYEKRYSKATVREKIISHFGISPDELQRRILFDMNVKYLYNGMTIFMREEDAMKEFPSNNQRQKAAKILTKEMMLRNEAYSGLVRKEFSNHIRLSMHPSLNDGQKYSFLLVPNKEAWASPWHCVILVDDGKYVTMHRKDAEAAGFEVEYRDGRPYNFIKAA